MMRKIAQKSARLLRAGYRTLGQFLLLSREFPVVLMLNRRSKKAKRQGRMVFLVEITTTNEFFWLLPVLHSLHQKGCLLVLMCGERVRQALGMLVAREFPKPQPALVNLFWANAFGDLDFYLNATLSYDIRVPKRARYKINFPHTVTSKARDDVFSPAAEKMTDMFLTGSVFHEDIKRYFSDQGIKNVPRLHEVGCPKYDSLFDHTIDKKALIKEMGLDPELPLVLYAPTWNQEASIPTWLKDVLTIPERHHVNLVVKVHPGAYIDPTNKKSSGGVDWKTFFDDENLRKKRIFNAFNTDSPDIVMASDVTITDISTIWMEFYFLRRPIIFIDVPEFFKRFGMNSLGEFRDAYGYLVKTSGEMHAAVAGLLAGTIPKRAAPSIDERLLYNKGKATAAAVSLIEGLYRNNQSLMTNNQ